MDEYSNLADVAYTFLTNLGTDLPSMWDLVRWATVVIGLALLVGAILKFRKYREPGGHVFLPAALWQLLFAVLAINLNVFLGTMTETVFGVTEPTSPLSYEAPSDANFLNARTALIAAIVIGWIQFVGYVAFARGILELNKVTNNKGLPGVGPAKGIIHLIGGTIAVNLPLLSDGIWNLLG